MSAVPDELAEYLLRDDKARIEMPSAEGHVGYPQDLIDLDDDALAELSGLKVVAVGGNGHKKPVTAAATGDSSEDS